MKILVATAYADDETLVYDGAMAYLVEEGHAGRVIFGIDGVEGRTSTPNSPPGPGN